MFSVPSHLAPQVGDSSKTPPLVKYIPETDKEIDADMQEIKASVFSSFSSLGIDVKTRLENQTPQTDEEYEKETEQLVAGMKQSTYAIYHTNFT